MLDCTWSDQEAEIVLRNLNPPAEEQERLRNHYLKLREEHRKGAQPAASGNSEKSGS